MNDLSWPDPIARARDLGPAIEAAAGTIEHTQRIGEPLLTQLHDSRLLRLLLPRSFGGEEVEPWVYLRALIAWGPPNAARARAVPGGYRISGEWEFASGCRQATWMGAHAQVEEADG